MLHDIVGAGSRRGGEDHRRRGDGDFPDAGSGGLGGLAHARRDARSSTQAHGGEDLLLKIGIHEGPCLAVMLNDRQDYFGQTVNIASRVQNLAMSHAIFATGAVVEDPATSELMKRRGLQATEHRTALRGMTDEFSVYEIP